METTHTENKTYDFEVQRRFAAADIANGVDPKNEVISIDVVEAGYRMNGVMGHKLFLAVYSRVKDSRDGIKPLAALHLGDLEVSIKEIEGAGPLGMLHYIQAAQADISVAKQKRKICLLDFRERGYETNKPKRVLSTSVEGYQNGRLSLPRTHF